MTKTLTIAAIAAVLLTGAATQPVHALGCTQCGYFNGPELNGQKLNGQKLNGQKLNGQRLNGQKLNGTAAQGSTITGSGLTVVAVELPAAR